MIYNENSILHYFSHKRRYEIMVVLKDVDPRSKLVYDQEKDYTEEIRKHFVDIGQRN